jgi:dTDP-glucose 4,6-dehydratase
MRLLVTGGAGFIGSNFVRRVVDGSLSGIDHVTVLDKLTYAGTLTNLEMLPTGSFEFVQGDICDSKLVNKFTSQHDAIVNFAAESHVDSSITRARDFIETNVLGTQNLLDCSLRNGIKTFVQISTDEVYGTIDEGSWDEKYPLLPNSPYSASKASADLLVRAYHQTFGLDTRITRCSNNYGPHQFPEKVIPLFVTNLIDNKKVPLFGKGMNVRDWLHVDDHCRGIHSVLMKGRSGEIYNIGGGRELTNRELTSIILEKMGRDDSSIEYVQDRLGHDLRYSVKIEKISSELGYAPKVNFEDGISETIDWYRSNEKWWRPLKK